MSAKSLYEYLLVATRTAFDEEDDDHKSCIERGIAYNDNGILRPRIFQGPQTYNNAVRASAQMSLCRENDE